MGSGREPSRPPTSGRVGRSGQGRGQGSRTDSGCWPGVGPSHSGSGRSGREGCPGTPDPRCRPQESEGGGHPCPHRPPPLGPAAGARPTAARRSSGVTSGVTSARPPSSLGLWRSVTAGRCRVDLGSGRDSTSRPPSRRCRRTARTYPGASPSSCSVVFSAACLSVSSSVKRLLIQIFTVDKQIQKINRCVLQMYLTKITSLVMRRSSLQGCGTRRL